jgi:hypothetical protein
MPALRTFVAENCSTPVAYIRVLDSSTTKGADIEFISFEDFAAIRTYIILLSNKCSTRRTKKYLPFMYEDRATLAGITG